MTPMELKREAMQKLLAAKNRNKEQFQRFFVELYKIEKDPYAPIRVADAFPGIDIPNVELPGQTLEELWPHYFICNFDTTDPNFKDYQPNSPVYKKEFEAVVGLVKRVRARAEEINREAERICALQSKAGS